MAPNDIKTRGLTTTSDQRMNAAYDVIGGGAGTGDYALDEMGMPVDGMPVDDLGMGADPMAAMGDEGMALGDEMGVGDGMAMDEVGVTGTGASPVSAVYGDEFVADPAGATADSAAAGMVSDGSGPLDPNSAAQLGFQPALVPDPMNPEQALKGPDGSSIVVLIGPDGQPEMQADGEMPVLRHEDGTPYSGEEYEAMQSAAQAAQLDSLQASGLSTLATAGRLAQLTHAGAFKSLGRTFAAGGRALFQNADGGARGLGTRLADSGRALKGAFLQQDPAGQSAAVRGAVGTSSANSAGKLMEKIYSRVDRMQTRGELNLQRGQALEATDPNKAAALIKRGEKQLADAQAYRQFAAKAWQRIPSHLQLETFKAIPQSARLRPFAIQAEALTGLPPAARQAAFDAMQPPPKPENAAAGSRALKKWESQVNNFNTAKARAFHGLPEWQKADLYRGIQDPALRSSIRANTPALRAARQGVFRTGAELLSGPVRGFLDSHFPNRFRTTNVDGTGLTAAQGAAERGQLRADARAGRAVPASVAGAADDAAEAAGKAFAGGATKFGGMAARASSLLSRAVPGLSIGMAGVDIGISAKLWADDEADMGKKILGTATAVTSTVAAAASTAMTAFPPSAIVMGPIAVASSVGSFFLGMFRDG